MANGVICPACDSELKGKVKKFEVIDCPECNKEFTVTVNGIQEFKRRTTKQTTGATKLLSTLVIFFLVLMVMGYILFPQKTPTTTNNPSYSTNKVNSTSTPMSFSDCKNRQASAVLQLAGTANKTMTIVNSSEVSMIKICTSDGAVLVTCSADDGKMVNTKTDDTSGC